ncbi:glucosamine-6-phosphate isomerase [Levilactobacillus acidifarinae DSM 19394]|uniref:Glucosamine-6-phosphate deaminase n=2 Tax=Levilactobacillus acidifarinae TaxID=267364 RepID=A0A0R1LU44_9LACO|nr:glucosamine-6-phosphate isomerase [Levilactobacillus acidifarinae DSM 19394]
MMMKLQNMHVQIVKDQAAGGKAGFQIFQQALTAGAKVLGLATGSTPISIYQQLVASDLDFSQLTSVNLDEYVGLGPDHPQSYRYFMQQYLFNAKPFAHSYVPDGLNADAAAETKRYDDLIAANPIDLQLLGLGRNGHVGFNEPGTDEHSTTHKVALTQSTIDANARFFDNEDEVPRYAYSMGIGSILQAKEILIVAYGEAKAAAVAAMLQGPVTPDVPASFLQTHPNVHVILDEAAASQLK